MKPGGAIAGAHAGGFRQLQHYPGTAQRVVYLAIVVLATASLYYELYVQAAVAPQIMLHFGMSLSFFILIAIVGNLVGALASLAAGVADQWGRSNIVIVGLLLTALLTLFGLPNASGKYTYLVLFAAVSLVEGAALVATPALIRDFSPQLGRATAMGFWSLGPVIGSLVIAAVASHTLTAHPAWQFQFRIAGIVGLVVFAIALAGLRELSPRLRNQVVVDARDTALVEARASRAGQATGMGAAWRAVMRADILVSAVAISVFLSFYYLAVGVFVIYFMTGFGWSGAQANALLNWFWLPNAVALVVAGVLSDVCRVRKPFMLVGAIATVIGIAVFIRLGNDPGSTYEDFKYVMVLASAGTGVVYATWMASYSETVERDDPAAIATGLAVWGGILRGVVMLILIAFALTMTDAAALAQHGAAARAQWNGWWIYCLVVAILFIPSVFLMAGRWSPAAARRDAREHATRAQAALAVGGNDARRR